MAQDRAYVVWVCVCDIGGRHVWKRRMYTKANESGSPSARQPASQAASQAASQPGR